MDEKSIEIMWFWGLGGSRISRHTHIGVFDTTCGCFRMLGILTMLRSRFPPHIPGIFNPQAEQLVKHTSAGTCRFRWHVFAGSSSARGVVLHQLWYNLVQPGTTCKLHQPASTCNRRRMPQGGVDTNALQALQVDLLDLLDICSEYGFV